MASAIDETKPIPVEPTTESVRDNFRIAKTEISGLQALTAGAPFLPLSGGLINGILNIVVPDLVSSFACAGATMGVRINHNPQGSNIQGVDNTWSGSFQPINLEGTMVSITQAEIGVVGLRMNPDASISIPGTLSVQSNAYVTGRVVAAELDISGRFAALPDFVIAYADFDAPNFLAHIADGVQVHNQLRVYGPITATVGATISGLVHCDNLQTNQAITVGGNGIIYSRFDTGGSNHIAWGWTGTGLHAYVDGDDLGAVPFAASSALVNAVKELTERLETVEALLVKGDGDKEAADAPH